MKGLKSLYRGAWLGLYGDGFLRSLSSKSSISSLSSLHCTTHCVILRSKDVILWRICVTVDGQASDLSEVLYSNVILPPPTGTVVRALPSLTRKEGVTWLVYLNSSLLSAL